MVSSLSAYAVNTAKTVTLVADADAPYIINSDKDKGYAYDVAKAAFESQGYQVTIKILPWVTAMNMAKSGEADGIFPLYYTLARTQYFEYSNPFLAGPLVLFKRANSNINLKGLDPNNLDKFFNSLKQYRFGIASGYASVPAFDKNTSLKKVEASTDKQSLENLYDGKVDLIIIDKLTAQYILRYELAGKYNEALVAVSPALRENNIYVGFSKAKFGIHDIVEDFNKGLLKLQREHATTKLMSNYIHEFIDKEEAPRKIKSINNF